MKNIKLEQFLQDKRVAAGLTQNAVASELGYVSPQFVSNWERGISVPPLSVLNKLGALYGVSDQVLFELVVQNALAKTDASMRNEFKKLKKAK